MAAVWASAALVSAGPALGAPVYEITDLGRGISSAVNDAGQATGNSIAADGLPYAYVFNSGVLTFFGPAGSTGFDINNSGSVTGTFSISGQQAAFLYRNGSTSNIGALPGATSMRAEGINASSQVVGYADFGGPQHSFLYSAGVLTDLGTLGGLNSNAFAINNAGQITGFASRPNGQQVPFLFKAGTMIDIFAGTAVNNGNGYDINSSGEVLGTVVLNGAYRPFTFEHGVSSVFDIEAIAQGINDAGAFVGSFGDFQGAFVSYGGGIADLNQMLDPISGTGWHLSTALDINNNGQIVGQGMFGNQVHGFMATCVSGCNDPLATRLSLIDPGTNVSSVPEPETYGTMLAGMVMLRLALRRRDQSAPARPYTAASGR